MRTFAQKQKQNEKPISFSLGRSYAAKKRLNHRADLNLHLQSNAEELEARSPSTAQLGNDFNGMPVCLPAIPAIQMQFAINKHGDEYEREADHISELVMRLPDPQSQRACACGGGCPGCQAEPPGQEHEHLQTMRVRSGDLEETIAPPIVNEVLATSGHPLGPATRGIMEPLFGHGFSKLRVHTDAKAAESARAIGAIAYTVGQHIVFGAGRFAPATHEGRRLIAHELTHVVQQSRAGGACTDQKIQRQAEGSEVRSAGSGPVVEGTGDVSVYVGKTMTSEAALREIYRQSAREISEEALRMIAQGTAVEDAARWAHQARNDLKVFDPR